MYLCVVYCTVHLAAALSVLSGRWPFLDFISNNYNAVYAVIFRYDFLLPLFCVF